MKGSIRLGRLLGIEIGVHYTWLLAVFLIAWSLGVGYFPQLLAGQSSTTYWIMGVVAAVMLFVSVLIHEFAHSLVARARGLGVKSITLFIFGGVSNIEGEPERPQVELAMAIVGPASSLVLGGVFWLLWRASGPQATPLSALLYYLAFINALLGVFNLLPGFPLDGGRVLRSIIWRATGSLVKATNAAATVGNVFGWVFIAYGVLQVLNNNWLGGLWTAFIGWFLSSAAESNRREVGLQNQLVGVKVKDVMEHIPECITRRETVEAVVRENFIQHGRRAVPICDDDRLAGIVTLTDVKKLPQARWAQTPVEEIMTRPPLHTVKKDDDLNVALKLLAQYSLNQVPVLEGDRLVGLLSRADVIRYLQVSQELGIKPSASR